MRKGMSKFVLALCVTVGLAGNVSNAYAQKFNSAITNPFVFCSAPKPCKICQPLRAIWEDICANQENASKVEERDPAPAPSPVTPPQPGFAGNKSQIQAEIARLTVIWKEQGAISRAAYDVVQRCVQIKGRVQDGHCGPEMEDFMLKRIAPGVTRDEIYRLEALLVTMG